MTETSPPPPAPPSPPVPEVAPPPVAEAPAACCAPKGKGVLALFVSALALSTALTLPLWQPMLYPVKEAPAASAATVDLAPFEARLAVLEARPQVDVAALQGQVEALGQTVADLQAARSLTDERVASKLEALEKQTEALRTELAKAGHASLAEKSFTAATLQLGSAWQSGSSFEAPWLTVQAAAAQLNPALALALNDAAAVMLPWRDKGIPTLFTLQDEFPAAARAAVVASAPKEQGWVKQSWQRIKGLVVIRRVGAAVPAEDVAVDAILARAEEQVKRGDLSAALEQLDALPDEALAPLQTWRSAARARLRAEALAVQLASVSAASLVPEADANKLPGSEIAP